MLKGLAIVGVMVQHAFSPRFLHDSWDTLWAGQAVPIFFILMGLNATRSMDKGGAGSLRELYTRRYLTSRLQRLVVPLLFIWVVALIVAVIVGEVHIGPLVVVGVLPLASAPGNYFVTIVLEFAVLFPAVYWCWRRAPVATTVVLVLADIGFELLAPHVHVLTSAGTANGYLYEAAIFKYLAAIAAGMWLTRLTVTPRLLAPLCALAAASFAYLIVLHQSPTHFGWLIPSFSASTNFLSVFYAVLLTYAGLRWLTPRSWRGAYGLLERLGQASYHIFLLQIVWFGAITDRSAVAAIFGIAACCLLGHAFFVAMERRRPSPGAGWRARTRSARA